MELPRNHCYFWSLLLLLSTCPIVPALAPPRFDTFSERLLGGWVVHSNDNHDHAVEEVMRRCGGAVQGIQEADLHYLNRANDGFIYYDSGCYSEGPVRLSTQNKMVHSFPIEKNSRVLMSCELDQSDRKFELHGRHALLLVRTPSLVEEGATLDAKPLLLDKEPADISWSEEIICSMASPSQPWILQRARWELRTSENPSVTLGPATEPLTCWSELNVSKDGGVTVSSGVLQNVAVCVSRSYRADGNLISVSLRNGSKA